MERRSAGVGSAYKKEWLVDDLALLVAQNSVQQVEIADKLPGRICYVSG